MKNWILALGALSLMGSACNPVVLEPLQRAEVVETPVDPVTSLPRGGGAATVLAMRSGDVNWPETFSLGAMISKPWSDPETLVLFFSTESQQCDNPVLPLPCNDERTVWQFVIGIPPELARPGLIDLFDPRVIYYSTISYFTGDMPCAQSVGGNSIVPGTMELVSDGSGSLSVKLQGVAPFTSFSGPMGLLPPGNIDGEYTVQPCGGLPPVAPPTPALAIRGVDLSPSPADGSYALADSLVVFLGSLPDTCQDPWAAASCATASRLSFTLPLELQKPGVLSLDDPAIVATFTAAAASGGTSACGLPSSPLEHGTVEILSSDASGLTFKIYHSSSPYTALATWLYFDGLYAAPICP